MRKRGKNQRGFVALLSTILISSLLLIVIYTLETSSFFARFDQLDAEYKTQSWEWARGCADVAMVKIARDSGYAPGAGGECVSLGGTCGYGATDGTCKICEVTTSGNTKTIVTRAVSHDAFTNLKTSFDPSPGGDQAVEASEIPSYRGQSCPLR